MGELLSISVMDEERFERHDLVGQGDYYVRVKEEKGKDVVQEICLTV